MKNTMVMFERAEKFSSVGSGRRGEWPISRVEILSSLPVVKIQSSIITWGAKIFYQWEERQQKNFWGANGSKNTVEYFMARGAKICLHPQAKGLTCNIYCNGWIRPTFLQFYNPPTYKTSKNMLVNIPLKSTSCPLSGKKSAHVMVYKATLLLLYSFKNRHLKTESEPPSSNANNVNCC